MVALQRVSQGFRRIGDKEQSQNQVRQPFQTDSFFLSLCQAGKPDVLLKSCFRHCSDASPFAGNCRLIVNRCNSNADLSHEFRLSGKTGTSVDLNRHTWWGMI